MKAVAAWSVLGPVALGGAGCAWAPPPAVGTAPVPRLAVDLGTVDAGDGKPFRVTIPANDALRRTLSDGRFEVHSSTVSLSYFGSGPGTVTLAGTTHDVRNCTGFTTEAAVLLEGTPALTLDLQAKVRPAFEVAPLIEGERYAIRMAPGVAAPAAVDRSEGIDARVVPTGAGTAELILRRERPARIPGGLVRLIERGSGETRVVALPLPRVDVWTQGPAMVSAATGKMAIGSSSDVLRAGSDVDVVLDPPGAYEIVERRAVGRRIALTLRSLTRAPVDLTVGFRRKGRWIEIQRKLVD